MRFVRVAACMCAVLLLAHVGVGPANHGDLNRKVADEQGALIPGATVSATNPATGFNRTAVSDAEGIYRLNALPVGQYDLAVELVGLQRRRTQGLRRERRPDDHARLLAQGRERWRRRSPSMPRRR